jgi:serine/threonine-protein kinase
MLPTPSPDNSPSPEAVRRLEGLTGSGLLTLLLAEQRRCWQAGQRVPAEEFRRSLPQLQRDDQLLLDLIWSEVLLREDRGESPSLEEYRQRFPHLAEPLRLQFQLHHALAGPQSALLGDSAAGVAAGPPPEAGQQETVRVPANPPEGAAGPSVVRSPGDGTPKERIRVALVAGRGGESSGELHALLLRRLRIFTTLVAGFSAFLFGLAVWVILGVIRARIFEEVGGQSMALFTLSDIGVPLVVSAVSAIVLWLRPPASLRALRAVELLVTGTIAAMLLLAMVHPAFYGKLERAAQEPGQIANVFVGQYGDCFSLRWLFLILAYGTMIPNTWRRCAAVVSVLALSPLVFFAVWGLWVRPLEAHITLTVLLYLTFWMGLAAATVVFTSYRIELLTQQAAAARKLGQYVLKGRLGAGGMGEVYLAEHVLLRRPCALKLIRPERAGDPRHLRRFEREVQVTATLTHPNTVQIFDYGHAEDGTFYYVMEYLPGLTLEQLVERHGPLPPGRAIHFLRQLCAALGEAHAVGLIHRDLKPGNVIVCRRGGVDDTVKLLDFGLVLPRGDPQGDRLTQEGAVAGTPAYMSPEQAGGQEDLDARSDIYSLGAVAYFLLTGRPPFAGRSVVQVLAAHLYERPAPLTQWRADVPDDLQAVVLRCLAKEPGERYADVADLTAALAGCQAAGAWSAKEAAEWWGCRALAATTVACKRSSS